MCDECDESGGLYVAYFNKPGGRTWRPAQKAVSAPLAVDCHAVAPVAVTVREVRRFTCDEEAAGRSRIYSGSACKLP